MGNAVLTSQSSESRSPEPRHGPVAVLADGGPEATRARGVAEALPRVPFVRLRSTLVAQRDGQLPAYKGSLLRGAFGHALRRTVCAMTPDQSCATCALSQDCIHARIFEEPLGRDLPPFLKGLPAAPRPYLFEPRLDESQGTDGETREGDELELDLLLFGQVIELQSFAVKALQRMGRDGLGARRIPFALDRVRYPDGDGSWRLGFQRGVRPWEASAPALYPSRQPLHRERLRLRFVTPTRIKVKGRLVDDFTFRTLAFRILRRVLELAHFYVPSLTLDADYEPLLARADDVRVVSQDLRWKDWQRFSNRQHTKMKMGGFVGEVTLEGDLNPFSELLQAAEVVHVGKGTTFGLGKVEIA